MLSSASCLVIGCKALHRRPKFKYLDRALRPVVFPANDDIALIRIVAVLVEAPGLILELNSNPLPHTGLSANPTLGLAIEKPRLDDLSVRVTECEGQVLQSRIVLRSRRPSTARTLRLMVE